MQIWVAQLSLVAGVGKYMRRSWYRTLFSVPFHWEGNRIMLHFGAVDWQCQVYVNGEELGVHTGGFDKVSESSRSLFRNDFGELSARRISFSKYIFP